MYRPTSYDPITGTMQLDITGCKTTREIHQVLAKTFDFPDYYGKNWDALWDCMTDLFLCKRATVLVAGVCDMSKELYQYCTPMFTIFEDLTKEYPGVKFIYL